jgi:DNA-binding CsgD family transcriptional regulator
VPRDSVPRACALVFSPLERSFLDKLDRGIAMLDANGRLLNANALALGVLDAGDGIAVRSGRFAFSDAEFDGRFSRLLSSAGRSANGNSTIAARVKRANASACRVVVSPLHGHGNGDERGVAYVVIIYGPDERREISPAVLRELYGLTRAQADVACSLYAGRSVEETATSLELSLNTVRTHLQQIFSKCEVQSQGELLHMLALGPHRF